MTITIDLPPETEKKLKAKAARRGEDVPLYVSRLIEQDIDPARTLEQILGPIRKGFSESGMSDDELEQMFEEAREEVWAERQQKSLAK
jgi:hypothetical protein